MLRLASLAVLMLASLGIVPSDAGQPASTTLSTPSTPRDRITLPTDVTPQRYAITVTPDLKSATFVGHVDIALSVKSPTHTIKLNAADLTFSQVSLTGQTTAPKVAFDAENETATLTFAEAVAVGEHTLAIDYAGKINSHAAGLFSLAYDTPAGRRQALFTQFENSDARRFVPSWDEPNRKAVFQLNAVVPAGLLPVSNMPLASSRPLVDGRVQVGFAPTPRMSSYLLYFGLGDFERIHRDVGGVDVGVIFKRGDASQAAYALDAAAHLLPYYNAYFGVRYPLPKLDMIAGPGQSQFFGAMENWGAIFYFERDLLIDQRTSTPADRQQVYLVVAHEMAHQWFGDLVTMDWWDDLWLNEGFASWMESKATDHFHPEWNLRLQDLGGKEAAMRLDARTGTHPVITPIRDVLQAEQAFDTITYQKGAAVIGMLESYVGADVWRAGVRNYIRAHAYGNTTTDDLWREIDAVSPHKLTAIAHDFTLQAGVPLVRVEATRCANDPGAVSLARGRFSVDGSSGASQWRIPAALSASGQNGGAISSASPGGTVETVIDRATLDVPIACAGEVTANAGQSGYFRTAYAPGPFAKVLDAYPRLPAADQLGLTYDSWALGEAGYAPVGQFLSLAARASIDADPLVWSGIIGRLTAVDALFDGLPTQAAYRAYAERLIAPVFARVGWDARASEPDNTALLRAAVISALSEFNDPEVVTEARRRFAAYQQDPSSQSPETRRSVLNVVARHADAATWAQLHALARSATSALGKDEYYSLLSAPLDPQLAGQALDLAVSEEPEATEGPTMIRIVSGHHPELAFDFYVAHREQVNAKLEPDSRNQFAPRLASSASSPAFADKLQAFALANIPAGARGEVDKALSALRFRIEARRLRTPAISAWLAAHPAGSAG